ncbi:hypothetical protein C1645_839803 [Glomus cerebriforme]|uniref:Uncharacterized protein n=1 Tax=Glomus cerebriforme TaxID=658196 RepID=A0A397SBV3_9GLOM|nr:hypothetical protein C1645_839803 [Glomus cerebriforme]
MQSELDSLKQRVVELLAENAEIKAENAKVKAENAKLRQAMEENEVRLAKLEQSDKEKAKLIAELNCDVGKIKQERAVVDIATQPSSTSNKSLEDKKTDEFLVSVSKKKVSNLMRQRNKEKKLLRESALSCRDQDEHSISQNTSSILFEDPNDSVETENNISSSQPLGGTVPKVSFQVLPKETKSHDYIIAQDFIQEVSSELIDEDDIQIIDGKQELTTDMTIEVELAHLFLEVSIELLKLDKKRFQVTIHMGKSSKRAFKKLLPEIIFQIRRQENNYSRI